MVNRIRRGNHSIGWIDYLLVGVSSSLAVFSCGMAVAKPAISWFLVALVLIGTAFSYMIRTVARKSIFVNADGWLYSIAIVTAMIGWSYLQVLLPEEGFPVELFTAAWLSWALCLASFFTWRDSTLLFQAIPSIALFGLVGCYDTYRNVTFCFFAFLACLATLFARAHGRAMLRQAIDSGYFNRIQHLGSFLDLNEDSEQAYEEIKEGPWRWVAGPEWALLSAMGIILLSLLGAPIVQFSVRGVAGELHVSIPQSVRSAASAAASAGTISSDASGAVPIGNGPNNSRKIKVFEADLDHPRYLRTESFATYTGRGWRADWNVYFVDQTATKDMGPSVAGAAIDEIKHPREYSFRIRPVVPMKSYPTPAEYVKSSARLAVQRMDGTVENARASDLSEIVGVSVESDDTIEPKNCPSQLPPSMSGLKTIAVPDTVSQLARQVTAKSKTDFEKARAIKSAIEGRTKYNLNAGACPTNRDPVEFFLFDQKQGYCDLFASAMTAMSRSVGLPARYVIGYLVTMDELAGSHTYVVTEADAHAWCEIFFEGVGWVVFDATEGAEAVEGGERGSSRTTLVQSPIVRSFLTLLIGAAVLVLVAFAFRLYRNYAYPSDPKVAMDRAYKRFANVLRRASNQPRRLAMTNREYVETAVGKVPEIRDQATRLMNRFDAAYYSREGSSLSLVEELNAEIDALNGVLRSLRKSK